LAGNIRVTSPVAVNVRQHKQLEMLLVKPLRFPLLQPHLLLLLLLLNLVCLLLAVRLLVEWAALVEPSR
jgi:hypothetical protein